MAAKKRETKDVSRVPDADAANAVGRAVVNAKKQGAVLPNIVEAFLAGVMIAYPEDRIVLTVSPARASRARKR